MSSHRWLPSLLLVGWTLPLAAPGAAQDARELEALRTRIETFESRFQEEVARLVTQRRTALESEIARLETELGHMRDEVARRRENPRRSEEIGVEVEGQALVVNRAGSQLRIGPDAIILRSGAALTWNGLPSLTIQGTRVTVVSGTAATVSSGSALELRSQSAGIAIEAGGALEMLAGQIQRVVANGNLELQGAGIDLDGNHAVSLSGSQLLAYAGSLEMRGGSGLTVLGSSTGQLRSSGEFHILGQPVRLNIDPGAFGMAGVGREIGCNLCMMPFPERVIKEFSTSVYFGWK
jgi:hypothetical protein